MGRALGLCQRVPFTPQGVPRHQGADASRSPGCCQNRAADLALRFGLPNISLLRKRDDS